MVTQSFFDVGKQIFVVKKMKYSSTSVCEQYPGQLILEVSNKNDEKLFETVCCGNFMPPSDSHQDSFFISFYEQDLNEIIGLFYSPVVILSFPFHMFCKRYGLQDNFLYYLDHVQPNSYYEMCEDLEEDSLNYFVAESPLPVKVFAEWKEKRQENLCEEDEVELKWRTATDLKEVEELAEKAGFHHNRQDVFGLTKYTFHKVHDDIKIAKFLENHMNIGIGMEKEMDKFQEFKRRLVA